jgi:hypothetical protein
LIIAVFQLLFVRADSSDVLSDSNAAQEFITAAAEVPTKKEKQYN